MIRRTTCDRRRRLRTGLVASVCTTAAIAFSVTPPAAPGLERQATTPSVLVLYDSSGGYYEGEGDAIALENLLGHFGLPVERRPVTRYTKGAMQAATTTFYIGSISGEQENYDVRTAEHAAYRAFLGDAATTPGTLVWMGFNLDVLQAAMGDAAFAERFGIAFEKDDTGYNRVLYKGVELTKGVVLGGTGEDMGDCTSAGDGYYDCAPSLGLIRVTDRGRATVFAEAKGKGSTRTAPYATRGGNLWYVGDLPFSYVDSGGDRYLAFADLLHDMVGIPHTEDHRALVRLEDVHARTGVAELDADAAVLARHEAPFGVAAIPFYRDVKTEPGLEEGLAGSEAGAALARYVRDHRASIVQHGATHQWDGGPNPDTGSSGPDYEFYRVQRTAQGALELVGPVPEDSAAWAKERMDRGRKELERAGLSAFAWEAPHYLASATDYRAIREIYPVQWARVSYFTSSPKPSDLVSQLFPYEVRDVYGATVVPENLGFLKPNRDDGRPPVMPADMARAAEKARVVRDGFASFFFHPYLDAKLLDETVAAIKALGYRFVRPCSVVNAC